MDIYLIRHADAVMVGTNGIDRDEDRPLSDKGWKQAALLGKALKKRGVTLDLIVTSPLVRATQTATQIKTIYELDERQMETRDELSPGGRPKKLARFLNGLSANSVALVGHQPDLSIHTGWLVGEKGAALHFAKSGAAFVRAEGSAAKGAGVLMWLVTPEWLEGE